MGNIAIQIHNYTENNIFMTLYVQTLFVNKSTSNDNAVNQIISQWCIERDVTLVQTEREIEKIEGTNMYRGHWFIPCTSDLRMVRVVIRWRRHG